MTGFSWKDIAMVRLPRLQFSVRAILVAILLVGLNIAAARATLGYYPRQPVVGGRHWNFFGYIHTGTRPDGSEVKYWVGPNDNIFHLKNPHMIRPPRTTLLRIWSPVMGSIAVSLLTRVMMASRIRSPQLSSFRGILLWTTLAVLVGLAVPAVQVVLEPGLDFHIHTSKFVINKNPGESVHANPFWARYWRLLLGRPWPGDFVCEIPPEVSEPVHVAH
jgi:hypothetical protein